jgi:NAD(P)H-nitrite reductase large subunit
VSLVIQGVKDADRRRAWLQRADAPCYGRFVDDADDLERRRQAIVESYKVVCICNKIRRGVIEKAIASGATTLDEVRRRTRAATGPCGAKRCGPVIAGMLRSR